MHRNWSRERERQRVRRQGSEDARGDDARFTLPLLPPCKPRPSISKAILRAQADAAFASWKARRRSGK